MNDTARMFFKVLAVMGVVVVGTALAGDFEITRSTIGGGGIMRSMATCRLGTTCC